MKININFNSLKKVPIDFSITKLNKIGVVVIGVQFKGVRRPTRNIKFNSRPQMFLDYGQAMKFEVDLINHMREQEPELVYETYYIDTKDHMERTKGKGKYFCPYCSQYIDKLEVRGGTTHCPICGINSVDFSFRKANNLWLKDKRQR